MAVRLNIASAEFGWYSSIRVDNSGDRLWQVYQRAEQAFAENDPATAERLCRSLVIQGPVLPTR